MNSSNRLRHQPISAGDDNTSAMGVLEWKNVKTGCKKKDRLLRGNQSGSPGPAKAVFTWQWLRENNISTFLRLMISALLRRNYSEEDEQFD
ncbi:hypothetical protein NPIL_341701 [Nephila pilipes]|uniref:Uncharacterized protein n=1 Tax=Nephila pilipes TaxID=299642 RepID=A0A8X6QLL8_NEPPI|nr:hypothetical protein NPIL_341701 [Nephila pilipes]